MTPASKVKSVLTGKRESSGRGKLETMQAEQASTGGEENYSQPKIPRGLTGDVGGHRLGTESMRPGS